MMVQQPK